MPPLPELPRSLDLLADEELEVAFSWPFAERYTLLIKIVDYRAGSHAADTTKAWLMLDASF